MCHCGGCEKQGHKQTRVLEVLETRTVQHSRTEQWLPAHPKRPRFAQRLTAHIAGVWLPRLDAQQVSDIFGIQLVILRNKMPRSLSIWCPAFWRPTHCVHQ